VADALRITPPAPSPIPVPRLAGRATAEATGALAARQGDRAQAWAALGSTGLRVSRVGFGGYRVDDETPEHRSALEAALQGGVNLVDTSTNYTDGGSERLVGQVLESMVRARRVRRDEVVVVTKAGYLQGENLERAEQRSRDGRPWPEAVEYGRGLWHCIHPEFLADQLERSRDRLQLDTVDVLLLHNPEYYLSDAHERSRGPLEARRAELDRRMRGAFAWLEEQVAAGSVGCYGVSSNTLGRPADDPEATSLVHMLQAARAAGGEGHHFRVIQLPMNLVETAAALERSHEGATVLDYAARHGVAVLVNRPLNAIAGDDLIRLAEPQPGTGPVPDPVLQADLVHVLEEEFRQDIGSRLQAGEGSVPPTELFRWGTELRAIRHHLRGLEHWKQLEGQRILPRVQHVLSALDQGLEGELAERWYDWRQRYLPELHKLLLGVGLEAAEVSRVRLRPLREALLPLVPEARRGDSLSRLAVATVASLPGVTSVLVGMRRPDYVEDVLGVLRQPPLPHAARVLEAMPRPTAD
jgi:aryl-alcohol dehydrogenase-like predicted oxidoreductase